MPSPSPSHAQAMPGADHRWRRRGGRGRSGDLAATLHESLHHEVTKLLSRFFWAGENNKQKYHMVKWSEICKPKDQGGLGVISSKRMNIALLSKWLWRIQTDEGGLWLEIIRAKYLHGQPLAFAYRTGGSQFNR